ncbi:DeoR/GlpR family DNA-binding transcription regulator [Clostridium sp. AL.422]|uniref:DeoR/GlpR family DNA-binding transcription regulator n=1 Tax=Clostridium TaxID=1485 RepID=UPI00293DC5A3|nr:MULTISPECIES: DeoR/GlpR family DNA-binding transcription regulator [unclassified Clostridium]MDV4149928.1 DeoR/GlpR family DNA-binding transcription regulator [Clostridium sp. AL.422]
MIADERRRVILEIIKNKKAVSVQSLSQELKTSVVTIRRDLDLLSEEGLIKRSHGGAILYDDKVGLEFKFDIRNERETEIKKLIAKKAASYITSGDSIGIDIGTTSYQLSKYIKHIPNLNVVTASIPVVTELIDAENINVICTGGELSRKDKSLIGHNAIRTINEYILDKVFIGVAGISFKCGLTLYNINDALVKRVLIDRAKEVILLADSTKIGEAKHAFLADIDVISKIITDDTITSEDRNQFESRGIEVIIANE